MQREILAGQEATGRHDRREPDAAGGAEHVYELRALMGGHRTAARIVYYANTDVAERARTEMCAVSGVGL